MNFAIREIIQNRTIGPSIAMAGLYEVAHGFGHGLKLQNTVFKLLKMFSGDVVHIAT